MLLIVVVITTFMIVSHALHIKMELMLVKMACVMRWEEMTVFWNAGLHFAFVFAKCRGK